IDIDKAKQLLINLGDYFRNTLSNNEDYVSIETELSHVNAYLAIEKARFDEKLKIEVDVDKKVDCLLPQLILQPIVENAIKHGLIPKKNGGTIIIKAEKINSETHITVEDTGVGIDEEITEQLYNNKLQEGKIGLSNVHNRLKSIYGQEYGLKISNREEGGTVVQIIIPDRIAGDSL
ncbi:MAG: sensor histidine kinase, partial [Gottschalkiaceae bacterium]